MFEPITTVIGNLVDDPELKFTPSGAAVANVTVAATPKNKNKETGQYEDGETWFVRGSVWREAAENVAESLHKGDRVILYGRLISRSFDDREGNKRTVVEMQIDEIGPSLKWASAQVRRVSRQQGQWGQQQQAPQGQWGQQQPQQQGDPWQSPPQQGQGQQGIPPQQPWGGQSYDQPPF